jgi:hypothetical protein
MSPKTAIATYIAFFLISGVPLFADAVNPGHKEDRRWILALFFGVHSMFLSWIITAFTGIAIYYQSKEIASQPDRTALSRLGLIVQAVVFLIVALSWIGRVRFSYEGFSERFWGMLSTWYELVGWAAVDTGIFAFGEALLLWILVQSRSAAGSMPHGEEQPLLHA